MNGGEGEVCGNNLKIKKNAGCANEGGLQEGVKVRLKVCSIRACTDELLLPSNGSSFPVLLIAMHA